MLTGSPPFNGEDDDEILRAVSIGEYDTTMDTYTPLSDNAKNLISRLLTYNPTDRITAEQALSHPWFKTSEFANIYRCNTINVDEAKNMIHNLEYYKSDNIIKCAVLAYLVHQNTNDKKCINASYLFNEIDLNKDGKLEKNELESAFVKFYNLTPDQAKKKANSIFLNIDTDNNGFIESEEFIRACINPNYFTSQNYLLAAFNYFDNDKDGTISVSEVESKFFQSSKNKNENTKMQLRNMFSQIDINGDGLISFEEFSSMIKGIISS
jgi:calcium-dependent protein kinase